MLNFPKWPDFTDEDIAAVGHVLRSGRVNYWTGEECRVFEKEFADWASSRHAVSLANGTLALDAAMAALAVGPGDEVIVTPRTFLASASSVVMAGARPVFADVDRDTQNITASTIAPLITSKTKAIVCVHLAGMPCDMDPIRELAEPRGIRLIEDCAQAHGARYKGKPVGSLGDIAAWSFCQDKIMTTGGEGGMVTTDDDELWSRVWSWKDHGKSYAACYQRQHPPGFRWLHESFGTNARMLEMQAVIGRAQLKKMPQWHSTRRATCETIWSEARKLPGLRVPDVPNWAEHAGYKCYVFVDQKQLNRNWSRERVQSEIEDAGVPCFSGSCSEVYLEKAFDNTDFRPSERLPVARELGETSLMFLVHPTLERQHVEKTCSVLAQVMRRACS